jgi:hypothetical protein
VLSCSAVAAAPEPELELLIWASDLWAKELLFLKKPNSEDGTPYIIADETKKTISEHAKNPFILIVMEYL